MTLKGADDVNHYDLEFKDLESFIALYNYQNYTKAAERLYITQSALSRRITALEEELGVTLVDRTSSKIRITDAGTHFYKECLKLLKGKDVLYTSMNRFRNGEMGELRIVSEPTFNLDMILKGITALSRSYPDVHIDFECDQGLDLLRIIQEGAADLCFTHNGQVDGVPNIKKVILAKNNLRVGVGVLHPLYHRTSVSWSELNGEKPVIPKLQNNLALEKLMRRGASEGVTFSEHLLAKTTEEVLGYVATGKYICFGGDIGPAVDSGVGDYIKFIPVLEGENVLGWPVLAYREDNGNPLIQTMIKVYESEIIG